MSSRKHTRYKLLLDEGLPPKENFPALNNLHSLKHIKHDLKQGGAKDPAIYKIAEEDNYLVVVFNTKDFKPMIEDKKPTVICLSTGITNKQIDQKICGILKKLKPGQKRGHLVSVTNEGVTIKSLSLLPRG